MAQQILIYENIEYSMIYEHKLFDIYICFDNKFIYNSILNNKFYILFSHY